MDIKKLEFIEYIGKLAILAAMAVAGWAFAVFATAIAYSVIAGELAATIK